MVTCKTRRFVYDALTGAACETRSSDGYRLIRDHAESMQFVLNRVLPVFATEEWNGFSFEDRKVAGVGVQLSTPGDHPSAGAAMMWC